MSEARNDRNTVQFGPSRTPQSYQLDRLEENVKDLERETVQSINNTTQEITQYVDQSIVNITGNAELLVGTVVTYNSALSTGTVLVDTATVDFYNASSVRLEVDDVIILSANEDYPDPFCVGLISRDGFPLGYDIYGFVIPSQIPGLPTRVDPFSDSTNFLRPQVVGTTFYAPNGTNLHFEDYDTGVGGTIPLPVNVGPSGSFSVNGNVICLNTVKGAGSSTRIYDGTAWNVSTYVGGMWWPDPQGGVTYGAFGADTANQNTGPWLVEVDNTGAVTATDLSTLGLAGFRGLCIGGGHVVVFGASTIYVDGVVSAYTYNTAGTISAINISASTGMTVAIYGDYLYYAYEGIGTDPCLFNRAVGPADPCVGVGRIDLTNPLLTAVTIPNVFSSTGAYTDGEPIGVRSVLALDDDKMVIVADVAWSFYDPVHYAAIAGNNLDSRVAYHVVDFAASTVTSIASNDPSLVPGAALADWTSAADPDRMREVQGVIAAPTGTVGEMVVLYSVIRQTNNGSSFTVTVPQLLAGEVI